MALRSGSLNRKGMFETCNRFGWFFVGSDVGLVPTGAASGVPAAAGGATVPSTTSGLDADGGCSHVKEAEDPLAGLFTMATVCCSAAGWGGGGLNGGPAAAVAGGGNRATSFTSAFTSPFCAGKPAGAAAPNGALIPVWTICFKRNRN